MKQLQGMGLEPSLATYLVHNYGRQTDEIIKQLKTRSEKDRDTALVLAELDFALRNEMVITPSDFFIRRTGMLYFNIARLDKHKMIVGENFKNLCNEKQQDLYHQKLEREITNARIVNN